LLYSLNDNNDHRISVCLGLELLSDDLTNALSSFPAAGALYAEGSAKELLTGHQECVEEMREAASSAVDILTDILQYDCLQEHSLQLSTRQLSAEGILNEAVAAFRKKVRRRFFLIVVRLLRLLYICCSG
jgi:K+-sensing histidine kinase KdpD